MGNEILISKNIQFENFLQYKTENTDVEGESILECIEKVNQSGNYTFIVTGSIDGGTTLQTINYPVELYNYNKDAIYSQNLNAGNNGTEKRMLVLKYNGNLTINSTITPTGRNKKGMVVYCAKELTNNGTIQMSAKGTYNQAGENVFLYKNNDNTWEYVPALGADGGSSIATRYNAVNGISGGTGTNRKTGGGGSGAGKAGDIPVYYSGAGGRGTSYAGGSGGGAAIYRHGTAGSSVGGDGGGGGAAGAGNPGGLLIIYSNDIKSSGTIQSNGSNGSGGGNAGGGASGGGSINLFYKNSISRGTITATGGTGGTGRGNGGNGGAGCVTITQISE